MRRWYTDGAKKEVRHEEVAGVTAGNNGCILAIGALGQEVNNMEKLTVTSTAFAEGAAIAAKYTCDGVNVNPPLAIGATPAGTRSLALIMDDPDAPVGIWVHWVAWNIPAQTREIPENGIPAGAQQGLNDWKRNDYGGPCPPSGTHRYFFKLYALDTTLTLAPSTTKADLERAMQGHVLATGQLMGTYKRIR
jgi:Raf kinase inhibitor-like YbhB/YbcL family protein